MTLSRAKQMSENTWLTLLGRFFQLIGIPVIIVLVSWGLGKLTSVGEDISTLKVQVGIISQDQYHGQDAKRDFALRDALIGNNSSRIIDHEGRIRALEDLSAKRK